MKDCQALAKNKRASAAAATATSLPPRRGRVKAEIFKSIPGKLHSVVTKDCQALAKAKCGSSATAATSFPSRRGRVKAEIFKSISGKLSSFVTKDCQALAKTKWGTSATAASKISTSAATATSLQPRWGRVKAQFFESIPGKLSAAVTKACQAKRCSSAVVDNMSTSTSAATSPPPSAYASVGYPDQLWNMGDLE